MPAAPYRVPSPPVAEAPPTSLVLAWGNAEARGSGMKLSFKVWLGVIGCFVLIPVAPQAGLALAAALLVWALWQWHSARKIVGVRMHVESTYLVFVANGKPARLPIAAITEVSLQTRAIKHLGYQRGIGQAIGEVTVSGDRDVAHIELATRDRTYPLTATDESYATAAEAMGRVRVFLRKHGWIAASERSSAPARDELDSEDDEDDGDDVIPLPVKKSAQPSARKA